MTVKMALAFPLANEHLQRSAAVLKRERDRTVQPSESAAVLVDHFEPGDLGYNRIAAVRDTPWATCDGKPLGQTTDHRRTYPLCRKHVLLAIRGGKPVEHLS